MKHKYGEFTNSQIAETKKMLRKQIYFLLLIVDPSTRGEYENINVEEAITGIMYKIAGLNDLLLNPPELVLVLSLIQSALTEYLSPEFEYKTYRKLILDAGARILEIKED